MNVGGIVDGGPRDVRDLLGAYALDAVDDVERRAVERLVATDPESARELIGLVATAAMLGLAVSAGPPASVRSAVLSEIARTPQQATHGGSAPLATRATPAFRRAGTPRWTVWLTVAATALGAAAIPTAVAWQQAQLAGRAEKQAQAVAELLADPGASLVRGDVAGGGTATGVLSNDRALFTATGLVNPGAGKAYQLWVLRDGQPVPDAVMADDAGRVRALTDEYATGDSLAVTIEPADGSEQPTGDVLVELKPA